jgi:hypothetical protein
MEMYKIIVIIYEDFCDMHLIGSTKVWENMAR